MNRLTEKREKPLTTKWEDVPTSYYKIKGDDTGVAISEIGRLNKLGKLEDLEEHYGVPLNVLLKLLDQWSFYFPDGQNQVIYYFCLKRKEFYYKEYKNDDDLRGEVITVKFEDYKKFWFVNEDLSE